jgi:hypothetical protein
VHCMSQVNNSGNQTGFDIRKDSMQLFFIVIFIADIYVKYLGIRVVAE